jgi:hypothetical protein
VIRALAVLTGGKNKLEGPLAKTDGIRILNNNPPRHESTNQSSIHKVTEGLSASFLVVPI